MSRQLFGMLWTFHKFSADNREELTATMSTACPEKAHYQDGIRDQELTECSSKACPETVNAQS